LADNPIADSQRDDAKHFVVRAEEKLTAFGELEAATSASVRTELVTNRS
jgi:hypothetical protein